MPEEESCGATQDVCATNVMEAVKEAVDTHEKKVDDQAEALKRITEPKKEEPKQ